MYSDAEQKEHKVKQGSDALEKSYQGVRKSLRLKHYRLYSV